MTTAIGHQEPFVWVTIYDHAERPVDQLVFERPSDWQPSVIEYVTLKVRRGYVAEIRVYDYAVDEAPLYDAEATRHDEIVRLNGARAPKPLAEAYKLWLRIWD